MSKMVLTEQLVQIFCKLPEPGKVKTRLEPCLGKQGAADLYGELLERVVARLKPCFNTELWYASTGAVEFLTRFPRLEQKQQVEGDLGERMLYSMSDGLARSERVVLVGSDCPQIDSGYVAQAFALLKDHDVVLGPAEDGGYGLIGARRLLPEIFTDIIWSTDHVLSDTCRRLNEGLVNYAMLPLIWDIDRPSDIDRYYELLKEELS